MTNQANQDASPEALAAQIRALSPADGLELAAGLLRRGKTDLAMKVAEAAMLKLQEAELKKLVDEVMRPKRTEPSAEVAPYGYCPRCGANGEIRERRPNGNDKCTSGHKYPSAMAVRK